MPISRVQAFAASIPQTELHIDALRGLARDANRLAVEEPQLAAPFSLIRDGFHGLADDWEGKALEASVSQAITPRIVAAARRALESPSTDSWNELARLLGWAREYPLRGLVSGA
jgi:hypothetical protein